MKKKEKIIGAIVITVIAAVFISIGYLNSSSKKISEKDMEAMFVDEENNSSKSKSVSKENTSYTKSSAESKNDTVSSIINVEIKGEVKKPDVYKMNSNSIVNDLIKESGGAKDDADMSSINRAAKLIDNQCIVIPKKGEKSTAILNTNNNLNSSAGDVSQGSSQGDLININTADKEGLKKLSGIGDGKAQKIIDYREEHGLFKSIDDIKNVSGIGDATFNNIKNKITVQ